MMRARLFEWVVPAEALAIRGFVCTGDMRHATTENCERFGLAVPTLDEWDAPNRRAWIRPPREPVDEFLGRIEAECDNA